MPTREGHAQTIAAYSERAQEYATVLGHIKATKEADRKLVSSWASSVAGIILDLGCGPGHWANFIASQGIKVKGLDPTPLFIEIASEKYPHEQFEVGTVADEAGKEYRGVLAWYSLIHCAPEQLLQELKGIWSVLSEDGTLLLGYFRGKSLGIFNHAVTPAWYWPDSFMAEILSQAGFQILDQEYRTDQDARPHGAIVAQKVTPERGDL